MGYRLRLVVVVVRDKVMDRVVRENCLNSPYNCAAKVLLWEMIRVGLCTFSMILAMVKLAARNAK